MAILCDMHSLMPVGFFTFSSRRDFLLGCLFAVVVIKCFMIGVQQGDSGQQSKPAGLIN